MSAAHAAPAPVRTPAPNRALRAVPFVLGLFFALSSLRTLPAGNIIDPDAARHAMNGAFVRDMVARGQVTHPVAFGKRYYSHYPALSIPYHPPLFPAIEAMFYAGGVSLAAARLAIALAAAITAILLYGLILRHYRSHALAIFSTVAFMSWHFSQWVANDVMLEFPALTLVVAALYFVRDPLDRPQLYIFAVIAGAAVWTKQNALFLGLVPFACVVLRRDWQVLRRKTIWLASALFGAAVAAFTGLVAMFGWTGLAQAGSGRTISSLLLTNPVYYSDLMARDAGKIATALIFAAVIVSTVQSLRGRREDSLFLAWAFSGAAFLVALGMVDPRYLLFAAPPVIVVAFRFLQRLCVRFTRPVVGSLAMAALTAVFAVAQFRMPLPFLKGPAEAAATVLAGGPARIVYCGGTGGQFTFAVRSRDPRDQSAVIRGDRLPAGMFTPAAFENFAHRYGVRYVILERTNRQRSWYRLAANPAPSMVLERVIPLEASDPIWRGSLAIYRFTDPSPKPDDTIKLRLSKVGGDWEGSF